MLFKRPITLQVTITCSNRISAKYADEWLRENLREELLNAVFQESDYSDEGLTVEVVTVKG